MGRAHPLDGKEQPFTLIGRLQFKSDAGVGPEWIARLWMKTAAPPAWARTTAPTSSPARSTPAASCPKPAAFAWATTTAINGKSYSVAYSGQAQLVSPGRTAQLPPLGQPFDMVELRSADGEVLSIDYGHTPPSVERGARCCWKTCKLQGLKTNRPRKKKAASSTARIAAHRCRCSCPPPKPDLRLVRSIIT